MINEIKNRLKLEIKHFIKALDKKYSLKRTSPVLYKEVRKFVLQNGKMLRPVLFVLSYKSYSKKIKNGLWRSALALELLHDFIIIHDDIIDNAKTRRGMPSMHEKFNAFIAHSKSPRFTGKDLSIIAGDVMYAMSIEAFLSIEEDAGRKEIALKDFIRAAAYTGSGQFMELLASMESIKDIKEADIYRIYDHKTAYYSFICPLSTGAILGGAKDREIKKLKKLGLLAGRAFQIKDDVLALFENDGQTGKPGISDLTEGKKTLPLACAYERSSGREKAFINKILSANSVSAKDLAKIRRIIVATGSFSCIKNIISGLEKECQELILTFKISGKHKAAMLGYISEILKLGAF